MVHPGTLYTARVKAKALKSQAKEFLKQLSTECRLQKEQGLTGEPSVVFENEDPFFQESPTQVGNVEFSMFPVVLLHVVPFLGHACPDSIRSS